MAQGRKTQDSFSLRLATGKDLSRLLGGDAMSWQKCPVCYGSGDGSAGACHVCRGMGILNEMTGLPPAPPVTKGKQEPAEERVLAGPRAK